MKAVLIYYLKIEVEERYLMELSAHEILSDARYPDEIKYGFFFLDTQTGRSLLIDNHYPKGHHLHIDGKEMPFQFESLQKLRSDFEHLVFNHFEVKL